MSDTKKIFLIDGSAFLYRAFHAIRSLSTSKGHPTNATFGFARIWLAPLTSKALPMLLPVKITKGQ